MIKFIHHGSTKFSFALRSTAAAPPRRATESRGPRETRCACARNTTQSESAPAPCWSQKSGTWTGSRASTTIIDYY